MAKLKPLTEKQKFDVWNKLNEYRISYTVMAHTTHSNVEEVIAFFVR